MNLRNEVDIITTAAIIADKTPAPNSTKGWLELFGTWFLIGFITELFCSMLDKE